MSFRARLLLAFALVVLVPLSVIALGIRGEMGKRVTAQYQQRVASLVAIIQEDLASESTAITDRLAALETALVGDNRLRLAIQDARAERPYLLDYAEHAMRLTGLGMLQLQGEQGRIMSSGHFRNEYDRLEPQLGGRIAASPGGMALVRARTAEGSFLALVRADSFRVGGRWITLVGGVRMDQDFLRRLVRDQNLTVTLRAPGEEISSNPMLAGDSTAAVVVGTLAIPWVTSAREADQGERGVEPDTLLAPSEAALVVTQPLIELRALQRSIDRWFLAAALLTGAVAFLAAAWLASRISRPVRDLAQKTSQIDLDRLDVGFARDRSDEIGALARGLGTMTDRLRAGASRLREAERRATVGEIARQVNHDIKNGLTPIRNVFRHLAQVAREHPETLPQVFAERERTIESGISYLETLATNYARLYPQLDSQRCDVNAVIREVLRTAGTKDVELRTGLSHELPPVRGDTVALRRIVENLIGNALDSLDSRPGAVTVTTEAVAGSGGEAAVRVSVTDTGRGMTRQELNRAFDDFYTTKTGGTGLGLSIVRRLVLDLNGTLRVESEPGVGTRFTIEFPAESADGVA